MQDCARLLPTASQPSFPTTLLAHYTLALLAPWLVPQPAIHTLVFYQGLCLLLPFA